MGRDTRERGAAGLNAHPLTLMSQPSPHDPQALFGCSLLPLNIRAELIERTRLSVLSGALGTRVRG
jgi:hypothetical protein